MTVSLSGRSCKYYLRRFSLVELLVVILIIGSLMALGVGGYHIAQKKLAETRTRATLEKIKLALTAYKTKHGYYIQEYGVISGIYYFRLDRADGGDNISKIVSYKDTPFYDPASTAQKSNPNYNQLLIDSYSGAKDDAKNGKTRSLIKYTCPATDAPFELRSAGFDRIFGTKDDIVVN
jgi:type II secretory pathway pseudopilin PulG